MPTSITWEGLNNAAIIGGNLTRTAVEGSNGCVTNATSAGDGGANAYANSVEEITSGDFEFRCTLGPDPSGRTYVGLDNGTVSGAYGNWLYAMHVSTENNTIDPHPPNSIFVYEGELVIKAFLDGVWNEGDLLRFVCVGGQMRYYVNCTLLYVSSRTPVYPMYAMGALACINRYIENPQFLIAGETPGSGGGGSSPGPDTGDSCSGSWTMPTPAVFPFPAAGGPQHSYFAEIEPDWGEHSQRFGDGQQQTNTIQTARVRRFEVEWEGLTEAQAATLDDYYETTRGWLKFNLTHPQTAESITGVRFESYTRSPHKRVWSQSRSAKLVRYTS